jgi:uncharacterized protein (DUF983 family)
VSAHCAAGACPVQGEGSRTDATHKPGGYLPVQRECRRCEAIADDSAADDGAQIINPLGIGTLRNRCLSGVFAMSGEASNVVPLRARTGAKLA